MLRRVLCLLAFVFISSFAVSAQPADLPGDEIKPIMLKYEETVGKPGRWAQAEFSVNDTPARYYVRGTDVSAPLSVQVIAADRNRPLQVTLHRQSWGRAEETGSTGNAGIFSFEGRAYGDVGVQLVSSTEAPAKGMLIFWQGAPAPPSMTQIYVPPQSAGQSATASGTQGSSSVAAGQNNEGAAPIMYIIAGLLIVIVALLGFMILKRGGGRTAAAFIIAGGISIWAYAPPMADAQIVPIPANPPEKPENPFTGDPTTRPATGEEMAPKPDKDKDPTAPEDPFTGEGTTHPATEEEMATKPDKDKDSATPENPFTGEGTTHPATEEEMAPKPDKDKDATTGDGWEPSGEPKPDENGATTDESYEARLEQAQQQIDELNRQASANRAEIENLRMLIESDKDNEPDPSNMPPLPLSCRPPTVSEDMAEGSAKDAWKNYDDCRSCYDQPLKDLDETLLLYEKLRIIYNSTRNFVNTAIAMGDAIEKPHYLVEATWAQQKADILKTFNGTKQAYDDKFAEFNDRLSRNLDAVGQCETKFNNNPMWRETDAKMFYQTIKASYQRAD